MQLTSYYNLLNLQTGSFDYIKRAPSFGLVATFSKPDVVVFLHHLITSTTKKLKKNAHEFYNIMFLFCINVIKKNRTIFSCHPIPVIKYVYISFTQLHIFLVYL